MKRFATLLLAAGMAAGPALAESHMDTENLIRTRDITGGDIYTLNGPMDEDTWGNWEADGVGPDWNDIGEIEDIILDRNGQIIGIVAEIGGFLDIGDKHVLIPVEDIRLTPVDDKTYVIVTRKTEEQLGEMESVDEGWWN
ncbi:PRC-barrel domain-containing protein [Sedimentitalea todarodis]|uniref:PRC-barrel domain-containing protein n=1 Tax=Sedimentitalea todarodis TaxID=1631240 RepID=A0ABU3VKS3_9RHOB|nr:PRC-barrel domain-containing protein [Sedimentitalea todarodis]MDU9006788.1 PRC-barrel domain-containing protein [Sedimentitalea todarodis]